MTHLSRRGFQSFTLISLFVAAIGAVSAACGSATPESPATTNTALAATAPFLGTAKTFAVLGGSTVTNTNATTITGDLGVNPGNAITGFPPGLVIGEVHAADGVSLQAQTDVTAAYGVLAGEPCSADLTGKDLGGMVLAPGVYCFSSSAQLTGALTLDAGGNADAVFVFKTVSTLTTATNASVRVINGGGECGVFWQIGSSATLGTGTSFVGSILALTSVSLTSGARVSGRVLARNGAVTMDDNTVSVGSCAGAVDAGADASPADSSVDASLDDSSVDAAPSLDASDSGAPDAAPPVDAGTGTGTGTSPPTL